MNKIAPFIGKPLKPFYPPPTVLLCQRCYDELTEFYNKSKKEVLQKLDEFREDVEKMDSLDEDSEEFAQLLEKLKNDNSR